MRVFTENSVYDVDTKRRKITRHPVIPNANRLRKDHEEAGLIDIVYLAVGQPAFFLVEVTEGVLTARTTSNVTAIEDLE